MCVLFNNTSPVEAANHIGHEWPSLVIAFFLCARSRFNARHRRAASYSLRLVAVCSSWMCVVGFALVSASASILLLLVRRPLIDNEAPTVVRAAITLSDALSSARLDEPGRVLLLNAINRLLASELQGPRSCCLVIFRTLAVMGAWRRRSAWTERASEPTR